MNYEGSKIDGIASQFELSQLIKEPTHLFLVIMIARDDILKIIKNHDPNKVLAHDKISTRMAKPCNACLSNPLELIFKSCLENGKFPPEWKKANAVSVRKKGDKQILENYSSISLLLITGKVFERILSNEYVGTFLKK